MRTYYCTVWFDGDNFCSGKTPYEFDYIKAENKEQALEKFKLWFTECYEHIEGFDSAFYEVEEKPYKL